MRGGGGEDVRSASGGRAPLSIYIYIYIEGRTLPNFLKKIYIYIYFTLLWESLIQLHRHMNFDAGGAIPPLKMGVLSLFWKDRKQGPQDRYTSF